MSQSELSKCNTDRVAGSCMCRFTNEFISIWLHVLIASRNTHQYSIKSSSASLMIFSHFSSTLCPLGAVLSVCVRETCCDENRRCVTRVWKQTTRSTLLSVSADQMMALSLNMCECICALGCYILLRYAKVKVATITCCIIRCKNEWMKFILCVMKHKQ